MSNNHRPFRGITEAGFTLIELLVGIAIVGMIVGSLYQITGQIVATYATANERQNLILPARYALERMAMFVQESDQIDLPNTADSTDSLKVRERVSNQYDNSTHAYNAAGDLFLDADNDSNGLINNPTDNPPDPLEYVIFYIDKTDPANWQLKEKRPDYGSSDTTDFKTKIVSEHLQASGQAFSCRRLLTPSGALSGRVEIILTLQQGNTAVTLKTTAKSRWMD